MRAAENNTIIIGDFNLPGIDWKSEQARDAKGKLLLETAVEEGLQQLVDFPTHTKGNTLDLLLTNYPDKVIEVSDSGRLGRSDHCMLKVVLDFEPNCAERVNSKYNWSKANMEQMNSDLMKFPGEKR
jgi:endonuclease/exonuclease/phosphatase family metal-dependent hydrolase